ncbi:MAG: caspase family protein, partial [Cytophagaceae bacterium]
MLTSPMQPPLPNLFALIVGIGAYQRVRPLKGPVNDAQAVATYLRGLTTFSVDVRLLTDEQATKAAIADGFITYLSQAKATDTVVFYFAGHGVQEEADPTLWFQESDGMLECLVCHDANTTNTWDFLLADKELRYLIGQVSATGAHVVTLFDCCHSGDNTRATELLTEALAGQDVRERRLAQAAPRRPYEAFCFQDSISADQLTTQGIDTVLPESHHVQISACESDQTALEVNGAGVFTQNLLGVLTASHGQISYGDLHNRVRQYMRFAYEQCPRVYVPDLSETGSGAAQSMRMGFLNQPIDPDTLMASAAYNASNLY